MDRPAPQPDQLTDPFWRHAGAGEFVLPRCEDCGRFHFYPRAVCPNCYGTRIAWTAASGRGEVYSYSVVHRAPGPAFAADIPYVVAIVKTAEGPHLMTRIVNAAPESVTIGQRVKVCWRRIDAAALPEFEPEETR